MFLIVQHLSDPTVFLFCYIFDLTVKFLVFKIMKICTLGAGILSSREPAVFIISLAIFP